MKQRNIFGTESLTKTNSDNWTAYSGVRVGGMRTAAVSVGTAAGCTGSLIGALLRGVRTATGAMLAAVALAVGAIGTRAVALAVGALGTRAVARWGRFVCQGLLSGRRAGHLRGAAAADPRHAGDPDYTQYHQTNPFHHVASPSRP
jgi:hypothetical protein